MGGEAFDGIGQTASGFGVFSNCGGNIFSFSKPFTFDVPQRVPFSIAMSASISSEFPPLIKGRLANR